MKKIINGKLYNTETAKMVGNGSNYPSHYPGDFGYFDEYLYKKKTGEFFLCGKGGPMTKYAHSVGQNCWSGGEDIIPLTTDEAKEWVEKYFDAYEYIAIFGEVEE